MPQTYFSSQDGKISVSALLAAPAPITPTPPVTPTHPDFLNINWNIMLQDNMSQLRNQLAQSVISTPASCAAAASSTSNVGEYHQIQGGANINRFLHPTNFMGSRSSNASTNTSGYQSINSSSASLQHSFLTSNSSNSTFNVSPDTTSNNHYTARNDGIMSSSSNDTNVSHIL